MAKRKKLDPELPLFDLPLHPEADEPAARTDTNGSSPKSTLAKGTLAKGAAEKGTPAKRIPAKDMAAGRTAVKTVAGPDRDPQAAETPPLAGLFDAAAAPFVERLRAGLADLAVQVLMVAVAITVAHRLGVRVTWAYWPPFAVLTLVFSFLYWVIPLAFWGQTPGMAWVGHLARSLGDEPLSFHQAFLRWLGALLTLGLLGLPMLLALGGHSLSDRLSQSETVSV